MPVINGSTHRNSVVPFVLSTISFSFLCGLVSFSLGFTLYLVDFMYRLSCVDVDT
jgi:hypothetical protein